MTDVRLTATDPSDSSVVPVACNAKGELLLESPDVPEFDGTVDGDLTVTGTGVFTNRLQGGTVQAQGGYDSNGINFRGVTGNTETFKVNTDGSADFASVVSTEGAFVVNSPDGDAGDVFLIKKGGSPTAYITNEGNALFTRIKAKAPDNYVWEGYNSSDSLTSSITPAGSALFKGPVTAYGIGTATGISVGASGQVSLKYDGSAFFAGNVLSQSGTGYTQLLDIGVIDVYRATSNADQLQVWRSNVGGAQKPQIEFKANGTASFSGDVTVTSRGLKWVLTESGGLCHMISASAFDEGFEVSSLRDVFKELDDLKELVQTLIKSRNEKDPR